MGERLTRLALVAGSVMLALLIMEGAVRLLGLDAASYHPIGGFTIHDPELGWVLDPGRDGVFKGRHFAVQVSISPQGLRDRVYPFERTEGVRRVLVLGDSMVWCWGVEMQDCFTKVAERALPETEVISMGVPAYGTAQEVLLYERLGARFEPDLVVLLFTDNDPAENLDGDSRPRFVLQDGEPVLTNTPVPRRKSRLKDWLTAHSRLYLQIRQASQVLQHLGRRLRGKAEAIHTPSFERVDPERAGEAWALTEALMDRLRDAVRSHGGELVLGILSPRPEEHDRLTAYAASRGLRTLELAAPVKAARAEGMEIELRGDPHLSPLGNRVLGEALARELAALAERASPRPTAGSGTPSDAAGS